MISYVFGFGGVIDKEVEEVVERFVNVNIDIILIVLIGK